MAKETIKYGNYLDEKVIEWFSKHVGPRTHYLQYSVGGKGWKFELRDGSNWWLTVEDGKWLMYWTLMK